MIRGWLGEHRCRLGHPKKNSYPFCSNSIDYVPLRMKTCNCCLVTIAQFQENQYCLSMSDQRCTVHLGRVHFFLNKTNVQWGERSAFQERPSDLNIVCVCVHSCFSLQDAVVCLQFSLLSWFKDWRRVLCSASQATPRRSSRWGCEPWRRLSQIDNCQ